MFQILCKMKNQKLLKTLLQVVLFTTFIPTATTCPTRCTCSGTRVDCSYLQLPEIPSGIPNTATHLYLNGNVLRDISKYSLDGLPSLTHLYLDQNQIEELDAMTFNGLPSLTNLYLNGNLLSTLPEELFHTLDRLSILELHQNDVITLPEKIFNGLDSLSHLDLASNAITTLPENIFTGLDSLSYLYLQSNSITDLPENIFAGLDSLVDLYLYDNSITNLPGNVFAGLHSLEYLSMSRNSITTLPENIFAGLDSLVYLYLHSNGITDLPDNVFAGLHSLTNLYLHTNSISALPQTIFHGLGNLSVLELEKNHLATLPGTVFNGLYDLHHLNLFGNNITALPGSIFHGLDNLRYLSMYDNPWECDCSLLALRIWLDNNADNLRLSNTFMRCNTPEQHSGKNMLTIPFDYLTCSPPVFEIKIKTVSAWIGNNVSLDCDVTGIPKPQIEWFTPDGEVTGVDTIESGNNVTMLENGSLFITHVQDGDNGTYTCNASNIAGMTLGFRRLQLLHITTNVTTAQSAIGSRKESSGYIVIGFVVGLSTGMIGVGAVLLGRYLYGRKAQSGRPRGKNNADANETEKRRLQGNKDIDIALEDIPHDRNKDSHELESTMSLNA